MVTSERRARELAQRQQLIVTAARRLAEAQGWEAVTTRRLAEAVEYSQPVLYGHFKGKDAIVGAVALEGFAELGALMRDARRSARKRSPLRAVCAAYLDFAATRPALYQAMFVLPTDLPFASAETPAAMRAAFAELVSALDASDAQRERRAEVLWSTLHGMVVLADSGRIPPEAKHERLDVLIDDLTAAASAKA